MFIDGNELHEDNKLKLNPDNSEVVLADSIIANQRLKHQALLDRAANLCNH